MHFIALCLNGIHVVFLQLKKIFIYKLFFFPKGMLIYSIYKINVQRIQFIPHFDDIIIK